MLSTIAASRGIIGTTRSRSSACPTGVGPVDWGAPTEPGCGIPPAPGTSGVVVPGGAGVPSGAGEPAMEDRGVVSAAVKCAPKPPKPASVGRAGVMAPIFTFESLPAEEGRGIRDR